MTKNSVIDGSNITFLPQEVSVRHARTTFARIQEAFTELGSPDGEGLVMDMTPKLRRMLEILLRMDQGHGYNSMNSVIQYMEAVVHDNRPDEGPTSDIIIRRGEDSVTIQGIKVGK